MPTKYLEVRHERKAIVRFLKRYGRRWRTRNRVIAVYEQIARLADVEDRAAWDQPERREA